MAKGARPNAQRFRRVLLSVVAVAASLAGLALLVGGGYLLFAQPSSDGLPSSLVQVLAEEPTATPVIRPSAVSLTAAVPPSAPPVENTPTRSLPAPTTRATATETAPTSGHTATPVSSYFKARTATPTPLLVLGVATATPTRVAKASPTPTPAATADPTADPLPDTGFGGLMQPLAGFVLAGIALGVHAIRQRH